jgi:hypothetical protein
MLGFSVTVRAIALEHASARDAHLTVLAEWQTGIGGLTWIEDLVTSGLATKVRFDGYPLRYTSTLNIVLPLILDEAKVSNEFKAWIFGVDEDDSYAMPPAYQTKIQFYPDVIRSSDSNSPVVIDAWDMS